MPRRPAFCVAPLLASSLLVALPMAQAASVRMSAGADPHTRGEPAAMARLGYVAYGPFAFGSDHDTGDVAELLAYEPLVWIETAHFRIGCALSPLELRSAEPWANEWIRGVRAELRQLNQKLPRIDANTRQLDPWLRAHLVAQRLENLWAEVAANLGVTDRDFPVVESDDAGDSSSFRGNGPFLGMRGKFRVLLLRHGSSHARYTRAWQQREIADPVRDFDGRIGSLYWGGSEDTDDGLFRNDLALHAHLVFNVAFQLYSGYRGYAHDLPPWLATGLGHWHARRVSSMFPTYERRHDKDRDPRSNFTQWQERVRGLARAGSFEPLATLCDRDHAGAFQIEQHIQSWALVDWLMQDHRAATMRFLHTLKDPFHAQKRLPSPRELSLRQRDAIRAAFGTTVEELDAQWLRVMRRR